jgi:hypothetical protein
MNMKKFLLVTAALLVTSLVAQAGFSENVLFTCEGELIKDQGNDSKYYCSIVESWKKQEDRNGYCDIAEGKALRQVLAVCHVGDFCTVAAKGSVGNGPSYAIQKVFEAQRQPASVVQDYKRNFKP